MNRDELLAAVTAERLDCRWYVAPPKTPPPFLRDDEMSCARRRKALLDDEELGFGRWVNNRHGVKVWEAAS